MTEKQAKLIMMVGLPYSGKSTIAKTFKAPIVCPDQIRFALHGQRYVQEAEPMIWAIARVMVTSLFLAGHDTVVLDATNTTKTRRDEWKDPKWIRRYVVCDVSKVACAHRALQNEDDYIIPIIDRMDRQIEYDGILYGSNSQLNYEHPNMEEYISKPAGTDKDPQIYHNGIAADDI
jgi:predicted kinase